ncbi:MAG: DUF3601 domain-containing protein [Chloroflexota bacterium]
MSPTRKFTAADLVPGQTYRVLAAFKDYDGMLHPIGETWRFVQKNFLPYEDGLTLFVERDGQHVSIRLQWRDEAQGQIIDNFSDFVSEN